MISIQKWSFILLLFLMVAVGGTSCSRGSQQAQASEMQGKKKKKPKKCRLESCHVRMSHYHDGAEYLGKRRWFLRPLFYPNKEPKIGQGLKKTKRDPHQWNKRHKRQK